MFRARAASQILRLAGIAFAALCIPARGLAIATPTPTPSPSPQPSVTIVITPVKDNTLFESAAGDISNGRGIYLFTGRTAQTSGSIRRALISFEVARAIPAGSTITSARLTMHMSRSISPATDVSLKRVQADWGQGASDAATQEGTGTTAQTGDATWLHTYHDTEFWGAAGGDFAATASATISVNDVGSYTWGPTAQMTADVQDWFANPCADFGWIVIGEEAFSTTAKRFGSRESAGATFRPRLTIEYIPPPATPSPTPTATPDGSPTPSPTISPSLTPTMFGTASPSASFTPSLTPKPPCPGSPTVSPTPTATFTPSLTPTVSLTPTISPTPTATFTPSLSPTISPTPTISLTPSVSPTVSLTPTETPAPSNSPSATASPTPTQTASISPSFTPTPTATASQTETPSLTASMTPTATPTPPPPTIVRHPKSQAVNVGKPVEFSIEASGAPPIAYQWLKAASPLDGKTAATLSIFAASASDAGSYLCDASNVGGSTPSNAATLAVFDPPAANAAQFVETSAPPLVYAGETIFIGVTMRNTSPLSWGALQGYSLGVLVDPSSLFGGATRLSFPDPSAIIAPGEFALFVAPLTAPVAPGSYTARLRMIEELVEFFGQEVPISISVATRPNAAADWSAYE